MKRNLSVFLIAALVLLTAGPEAVCQYRKQSEIAKVSNDLAAGNPALCKVISLGKSTGGKDILVLVIGKGDTENKPGIAVIGGVEGNHNLGRELALGFASSLLKDASKPETAALLSEITFYVFPDASPDATDNYFAPLKYEQTGNNRNVDDDRDFVNGEDPFEDLNKDGFITSVRIADPTGTFIADPDDERLMVTADLSKGQKGQYLIISEGTDNDKDGLFNEDGPGGVNFNRNLTFNYEEFGDQAGLHPVSEPETKAILDFLFDHFNIYATVAFGPQDNLGQPQRSSDRPSAAQGQGGTSAAGPASGGAQSRMMQPRRFTSIRPSDEVINKLVSDKYHEITGFKGAPPARNAPGNFMDWSYYHYGRYSFSTPGWWVTPEKDKSYVAALLKFAEENGSWDIFAPWTEIQHPDFPGKKAEAGGIKPFATLNPPPSMLDDLITRHYNFVISLAQMHPQLEFTDIKTEDLGSNIYRVSLKVHNKGLFATMAEAAEMNVQTRIMRLSLQTSTGQKVVSGQPVQRINRLNGNEAAEFSWLISGKGSTKITAGAVNTGIIETSVSLK